MLLQQGVLTLDELHAQVAGGRVSGLTRPDAVNPGRPALWRADLRLADLRLEQSLPRLAPPAPGTGRRRHVASGAAVPLATSMLDARLSLRTPIVVGGTLAAPEIGIEGRRLMPRLAALAALALAAPAAALLPLLEFGGEDETRQVCAP